MGKAFHDMHVAAYLHLCRPPIEAEQGMPTSNCAGR